MPFVFGASSWVSDDDVPIPCLHVPSPRQPSAHAMTASLAESDNDVPILRIPPRSALVSCDSDDEALVPLPLLLVPLLALALQACGCG
jgi:hypothetical protein